MRVFARWWSWTLLLPCILAAGFLLDLPREVQAVACDGAPELQTGGPESHDNSSVSITVPEDKPLGEHYLLLVNTALAPLMTPEKLSEFDKSPYDGIAVAFWHAYDSAKVPSVQEMSSSISGWKQHTKKDIWPWIYVNRILGADDSEVGEFSHYSRESPYFHKIQGADLDDKAGAMSEFLQFWRNNLRAARDSHAPGIVVDLEFYNYHKEYDVAVLAQQTGKSPQETVQSLRQLGSRLADIAAAEYPQAVLWFFFTGFAYPEFSTIDKQRGYGSPAYIAMGMLDEIQSKHFHLKVLSGGETTLGYCHDSLQQFQEAIQKRAAKFAPHIQKYQGALELAGTMTLWRDHAGINGWAKGLSCWTSPVSTVEELQPYVELLLKSYRYNWIYAASEVSYFPFQPQSAARFNGVINSAKAHVSQAPAP